MPFPFAGMLLALAAGGFVVATLAAGKKKTPDLVDEGEWSRPTNFLPLAFELDDGYAQGTILAGAVQPETFARTVAVSGWALARDPKLLLDAFNIIEEVAWQEPETVFLLYQDLQLSQHERDEVGVVAGRFAKTLDTQVIPARDLGKLRDALERAVERIG